VVTGIGYYIWNEWNNLDLDQRGVLDPDESADRQMLLERCAWSSRCQRLVALAGIGAPHGGKKKKKTDNQQHSPEPQVPARSAA